MEIKCSFCSAKLNVASPDGKDPAFRCPSCNVKVVITNPSYLSTDLYNWYWKIVLGKNINAMKTQGLQAEVKND